MSSTVFDLERSISTSLPILRESLSIELANLFNPESPSTMRFQIVVTSLPSEVAAPMPVMTTPEISLKCVMS